MSNVHDVTESVEMFQQVYLQIIPN